MLHLRVVTPSQRAQAVRELLQSAPSVCNVVALGPVAERPSGEVLLCDVAEDRAEAVIGRLEGLGIAEQGSIAVQEIELQVSGVASAGAGVARGRRFLGWESVEAHTSESSKLTPSYVAFMTLAMLIAVSGILLNNVILIVGAMIVGPDFGPVAGSCVAILERRPEHLARSLSALVVGFVAGMALTVAVVACLRATGAITPSLAEAATRLTPAVSQVVSGPGFFTFFVAAIAGVAGMLSLSAPKSGSVIGVLVSVTTIPAAANVALAATYGRWGVALSSAEQLGANLGTLLIIGTATLAALRFATRSRP